MVNANENGRREDPIIIAGVAPEVAASAAVVEQKSPRLSSPSRVHIEENNVPQSHPACQMNGILGSAEHDSRAVPTSEDTLGSCWLYEGDPPGSHLWLPKSEECQRAEDMLSQGISVKEVYQTIYPDILPFGSMQTFSDEELLIILKNFLEEPIPRCKLPQYNTLEDAITLLRESKRIIVLTGAGVSVSCGIPDFRSKNGIYARLHKDFPDLPDPTSMFDIEYFMKNPAPFFDFAREIFPGQFEPSISHKFIKCLEDSGKLLRNYTQNIDTLEAQTGITRRVECHGSFSKATCLYCETKFHGDILKDDVMQRRVSQCPKCKEGIIKPDIVFFGEDLPPEFHMQMATDKDKVDLLIVIGSSMKVRPVSLIPFAIDHNVPQILINREIIGGLRPDIQLLGDCDDIVKDLCLAMGGPFEELVRKHDAVHPPLMGLSAPLAIVDPEQPSTSGCFASGETPREFVRERRRLIDREEFKALVDQLTDEENAKNDDDDSMDGAPEGTVCNADGAPVAKKARTLASMYKRRYVKVDSLLPENAYFQVSGNAAVFPGAELYYDFEKRDMGPLTNNRPAIRIDDEQAYLSASEDEEADSESSEESEREQRGGSVPPLSLSTELEVPIRPGSCHPDLDLEETVSSEDFLAEFRHACEVESCNGGSRACRATPTKGANEK